MNARLIASACPETAPLLEDEQSSTQTPLQAIFKPGRPLTYLEKALAAGAVLLLILSSVLIGLFAGAEGMLKKEQRKEGKVEWKTETLTATRTATSTVIAEPTGTPGSVSILLPFSERDW